MFLHHQHPQCRITGMHHHTRLSFAHFVSTDISF
jgi:hypothetical protein